MSTDPPPPVSDRDRSAPAVSLAAAPAALPVVWQLRLLGAVVAVSAQTTVTRWPSRAVAALLARLALAPGREHAREELVELLWPGVSLEVGRNRLRQALSTLKAALETAGSPHTQVIAADRMVVRVVPGALACDALDFEQQVRARQWDAARALYGGELMPGFYDEWVVEERRRLASLYEKVEAAPISELRAPRLSTAPPVPARAAQALTTLPNYWTRTFGVEHSASRLRALVCSRRLVTVHGPGGNGKTRLAVAVAQSLMGPVPWLPGGAHDGHDMHWDRVLFVSWADCRTAEQCMEALCNTLHVQMAGNPQQALLEALSGQQVLLLLDNLEQLQPEADHQIAALLTALPTLHVLTTSRRLLELDGEVAFALDGLAVPTADEAPDVAALNPAVALFVDRARAARADFHFSARRAGAIQSLVRLLAGMPLAIELAASKMRSLGPAELLQRLRADAGSPALDLLSRPGGRAAGDARHASMRHVVAWSWSQLTPALATLMQTLSVSVAPIRCDAVAAMVEADPLRTQVWLDDLCDASLLRASEGIDGITRFALLQPVREFAAEQCAAAVARNARSRLRTWLVSHVTPIARLGPAPLAAELPHVFAAIVSAQADEVADDAMRLAMALRPYWDGNGMPTSVLLALEAAVTNSDERDLRTDILELLSQCRTRAGFAAQALQHAEQGLALSVGDRRRSLALTRWAVAHYLSERHDFDFDTTLNEAVALAERANDLEAMARAVRAQSAVMGVLKPNYAEAARLATLNQAQWEQLGNTTLAQAALMSRLVFWTELGRSEEALAGALQCEQVAMASGEWTMLATSTWVQGIAALKLRRWQDAAAAFRRSIHVGRHHQFAQALAHSLLRLPEALLHVGDVETAARLQGFALVYWVRLFGRLTRAEERNSVRVRRLLRLRLGGARADTLHREGQGMTLETATRQALVEAGR